MLCLSLIISMLAIGTFSFAATTASDTYIKYSKSSNRSYPVSLNGAVISGDVYIFLADTTINSAMYFLDTNGNFNNSASITSMTSYPQDFQYKNSDGTAKPYNTKLLKDGAHTLVVRTRNTKSGKYISHTSIFTVRNTVVTTTTTVASTTTIAPTTTVAPATVAPTTTTVTPVPSTVSFAGDVLPGHVRWGSSIGGNTDPVSRHGTTIANRMGIRRTFWDMNKTSSLVSTAKADLAAGRLPWVSVKLNGSWKDNGDGKYDSQMTALLTQLSQLNGPVWFTAHHEPEGGCNSSCAANGMDDIGGPSEWLRMQANTSKLLAQLRANGKGNNIAFAPILMGWTFETASGRTPSQWFKAGIWDFAGLDVYAEGEGTKSMLDTNGLAAARKFYGDRGLKIAIGEWGVRNQNASETSAGEIPTTQEQQDALTRFNSMYTGALASATDGRGAQIIGTSYFDSGLNSPKGSWELTYLQLPRFRELVSVPTSVQAFQK